MQVVKQRTAHALLPRRKRRGLRQRNLFGDETHKRAFWQARFYDFNVWTTKKRMEKLRYMHHQSGETRIGGSCGAVALEQLSFLSSGREWAGASEPGLGRDFVSESSRINRHCGHSWYPPLRTDREGTGAPTRLVRPRRSKAWATRRSPFRELSPLSLSQFWGALHSTRLSQGFPSVPGFLSLRVERVGDGQLLQGSVGFQLIEPTADCPFTLRVYLVWI